MFPGVGGVKDILKLWKSYQMRKMNLQMLWWGVPVYSTVDRLSNLCRPFQKLNFTASKYGSVQKQFIRISLLSTVLFCLSQKGMDGLCWAMNVLFRSLIISCVEKLKIFGISPVGILIFYLLKLLCLTFLSQCGCFSNAALSSLTLLWNFMLKQKILF